MSATENRANFEIGTYEVPTNDNEHEDINPDMSEVIEYFGLGEAALRAGQEACLDRHNEKRALHQSTKDMKLDENLTDDAQKWAEKIARGDATGYDPDTLCGENISIVPFESELTYLTQGDYVGVAQFAVDNWYNQVSNYDFTQHAKRNPNGTTVSSFVQTIWKVSTYLGVGIARKPEGSEVVVVCRYFQKGNIEGNRHQQVGHLKQ